MNVSFLTGNVQRGATRVASGGVDDRTSSHQGPHHRLVAVLTGDVQRSGAVALEQHSEAWEGTMCSTVNEVHNPNMRLVAWTTLSPNRTATLSLTSAPASNSTSTILPCPR